MIRIDEKELKELFIEIKNNNKKAFEKLYIKYNKLVYGIAFSILKNKEDSEDIVQIVFSKLYEINKNKLPINKEASWLYSLTKNETISFLRKKKDNIDLQSIYEIEEKDSEINNIIDKVEFNKLISRLNYKEKQIISLKMLANLSFSEIGKLLNEPIGTIKWRYYKGVHTLKILLSNLGMCIVTFVIGIKTLFNKKISNKAEQGEIIKESQIEQNQENTEGETSKSEIQGSFLEEETDNIKELQNVEDATSKLETQDSLKDETNNINESLREETKEEINIQEQPNAEQINYYGVGILSISAIFLIVTITLLISFIKYQLKGKKKCLNNRKV